MDFWLGLVCFIERRNSRLTELQREFRQHFSEIVDIPLLTNLEKQEKEKFNQAWSLWYQFAHCPEQYWKNAPEIKAKAILNITTNELVKSIEKSLAQKLPADLSASILSDNYPYDGKKTLWIAVDLLDLSSFEHCFQTVVDVLTDAIRPVVYKDLKFFIMDSKWKNLVIVPMINGSTLSNISWVLLTASFVGEEPVLNDSKKWLYFPRLIEQQAVEYFSFKETESESNANLISLLKELKAIFLIINHAYCFCDLIPNTNNTGVEILQEHLSAMMPALTKNIERANEKVGYLKANMKNTDEDEMLLLEIIEDTVCLFEQPDDNQIFNQLEDFEDWALMLNNTIATLQIQIWENLA